MNSQQFRLWRLLHLINIYSFGYLFFQKSSGQIIDKQEKNGLTKLIMV